MYALQWKRKIKIGAISAAHAGQSDGDADVAAAQGARSQRLVPGKFSIDRKFDGIATTTSDGSLYIITRAGGKELYDPQSTDAPDKWLRPEDDNADYVARFVSDRHSLSIIDLDRHSLMLTQIDAWGREIDRCHITKG